jgi:hypothetical protein
MADGLVTAGAQATGEFLADLYALHGFGDFQMLGICIHGDEFHAM